MTRMLLIFAALLLSGCDQPSPSPMRDMYYYDDWGTEGERKTGLFKRAFSTDGMQNPRGLPSLRPIKINQE